MAHSDAMSAATMKAIAVRNGAVVDRTFPLADAAQAHRHLESGRHIGTVVLTI